MIKRTARNITRTLLAITSLAAATPHGASANTTSIAAYAPPVGYAMLPTGGTVTLPYGFSATTTNWNIAQWGTNNLFPTFHAMPAMAAGSSGFASNALSARVAVTSANGVTSQTFVQNGSVLPCLTPGGQPNEFDLFTQPNNTTAPSQRSAYLAASSPNAAALLKLGNMAALTSSGVFRVGYSWQPKSPLTCAVNQATALISIVLVDTAVSPAQVFFYQLNFNRLCEPGANYGSCASAANAPFYYFNGVPSVSAAGKINNYQWGMDDQITSYNLPLVQNDLPLTANLALLPRLVSIIQAPNTTMDHNIANWSLSGFYLGQHIWGDVGMSTEFTGFIPVITPKPGLL